MPGAGGEQEEQGRGKSSRHGAKGWKYKVMVGQWGEREREEVDWELFGQAASWDPHTKYFHHPHLGLLNLFCPNINLAVESLKVAS